MQPLPFDLTQIKWLHAGLDAAGNMNFAALTRQRTPLHVRLLAIRCYLLVDEDMDAACALFRDLCSPEDRPANVAQFIHYWWNALSGRYSLLDLAHGNAPGLSIDEAERAVQLAWDGYWCEGYHLAPLNLRDALENIPELAAIKTKAGVAEQTLWKHMQEAEPGLRRRLLVYKTKLTDAQKMDRWDCASKLRRYRIEELRRVFWIDASHIYVVPTGYKALVPPDASLVIEDDRLPKDFRHAIVLRFYCCVNAVVGPVAFKFHTGTTKLKQDTKYLVSARAAILSSPICAFSGVGVTWSLNSAPIWICW